MLSPSLAVTLNVSNDVCMVPKGNRAAQLL